MPYIHRNDREYLDPDSEARPTTPGELNFQVTSLVNDFIADHGLSYETLNEAIGVLECAKQELYRRLGAPYEDLKMRENGDVYPVHLLTENPR
jgi:hypothetical protein